MTEVKCIEIFENNDEVDFIDEYINEIDVIGKSIKNFCFKDKNKDEDENKDKKIGVSLDEANKKIKTEGSNYYIGLDWLIEGELALQVDSKLDKNSAGQTDILTMLFEAMKIPEAQEVDFYNIKFDEPFISIKKENDKLTPLLIIHYLRVIKGIVKKGLKKSYYKREENLNSRIKGKINIAKTLKQNVFKNRLLYNYCSFDEFGLNNLENRILKKALHFCQKALGSYKELEGKFKTDFSYCLAAFENVNEEVDLKCLRSYKKNIFYKEYEKALQLARLIFKRFAYNLKNTKTKNLVEVPPFWIDMAQLFELYVLGVFKDASPGHIMFQEQGNYGVPDFLYIDENGRGIILDAKYKKVYQESKYKIEDIRQLSGYARDNKILKKLGIGKENMNSTIIPGIIIYPKKDFLKEDEREKIPDNLFETDIKGFSKFYKIGLKLPGI